jgi:hypothetical protein
MNGLRWMKSGLSKRSLHGSLICLGNRVAYHPALRLLDEHEFNQQHTNNHDSAAAEFEKQRKRIQRGYESGIILFRKQNNESRQSIRGLLN